MTLQDKKMHLLDNDDEQNNDSDALDLFDQYGGENDDLITTNNSTTATQSVTRPLLDEDDEIDDVAEQSPKQPMQIEKKWEQEYSKEGSSVQNEQIKNPNQINKVVLESKQKNSNLTASTSINKNNTSEISHTKENNEQISTNTISKNISQEQNLPHTAAPVKQNYNSVLQGHKEEKKVQKNSLKPKEDKPSQEIHIDPSKKTILIVDDDIDTLDMYADVFESADYNVLRASDGLEAMNIVAKHTPHVIFTGIVMPRMDGFSMMEALKQNSRTADIPIVINSHLGRDTDKEKAEELGAHDFIIRGFTQPREVVERIGALLLKSEYIFHFNKNDKEARKLAKDLGVPNFYHCPQGQEMILKLSVADEKELKFSARFSCTDIKNKK